MTYLPRASIIRLPPGTIKLVPICLRNPTSNIIKKKTKKVPSRIQKILHLVSGTTRFHSNNSDSIFVNEKRFLRLFWFCFGYFFGFFFWFLRRVDCAIDSVLPDALDDAIFNVDVHVLDAVGVDHLAVSDQQPILGAL